jgi:hypothetical protein
MTETVGKALDISGLSVDEKRALLSRLLRERAELQASTHSLSFGQRSLWFLYNLAPGSPAYTITYAGLISGDLDVAALERAAQAAHHLCVTRRTPGPAGTPPLAGADGTA